MTSPFPDLELTQHRRLWESGRHSDITVLRFQSPNLVFSDIDQTQRTVKLSEVTHLRAVKAQARGVASPRIVAYGRLERDRACAVALTGVNPETDDGELLCSANSLLTYTLRTMLSRGWLRYNGDEWSASIPQNRPLWRIRAREVLRLLTSEDRLYVGSELGRRDSVGTNFEGFDVKRDLMPVDKLGYVREFFLRYRPRVVFNAAFFLLEHDDFFSHHSGLGEAYNLYVRDGAILRPPLYRRAAFYQNADGRWQSGCFSLVDMTITLPDGTRLVPQGVNLAGTAFSLNPTDGADVAVYTRTLGLASLGRPSHRTPTASGRIEYTIVDTRIVGRKTGGSLDIPQNGLVLSFAPNAVPSDAIPDKALASVQYDFARQAHLGIRQAIQAGPLLLQDGQPVLSTNSLADEQFWPTPQEGPNAHEIGIVPTDYPDDVDQTRAGRIGIGADAENCLIVVAVAGTERGAHRQGVDSAGATLTELASLLAEQGAVDAINLDGGGSTQLFYMGGLATVPGSRYGMPGVHFERMVPAVGALY